MVAAHLAREVTMRLLMSAYEYRGEAPLSVGERAAIAARAPFEAERLVMDLCFGRRGREAILDGLDDASARRSAVLRMLESYRGVRASEMVSASVTSLGQ